MSAAKRARCVMDQFATRYIVLIYDLVGSLHVSPPRTPGTQVATRRRRCTAGFGRLVARLTMAAVVSGTATAPVVASPPTAATATLAVYLAIRVYTGGTGTVTTTH